MITLRANLFLQCVCQGSKLFLQEKVLEASFLLHLMNGFDKLAVEFISLLLDLKLTKIILNLR